MTWHLRKASWSFILGRYLLRLTLFSLAWEILQLPLYTLALEARPAWIAYAIAHCTVGDALIGTAALIAALVICRADERSNWPRKKIIIWSILVSVAYTVLSERYNLAHGNWAYSSLMPIVSGLKVGLSPLLQWSIVPVAAWWSAEAGSHSV